jgi:large subunit ribosomal protein L15
VRLDELRPAPGAHKKGRRVGRGHGSGRGKTAGRGTKGQKARTGSSIPPYFEGGQLPLARRLPFKRGFTNIFRKEFAIVNVGKLRVFEPSSFVDAQALVSKRLLKKSEAKGLIKILGDGELDRPLTVRAHKFSATARAKIEAAGGTVETIPLAVANKTKRAKKPAPVQTKEA